MKNNTSCLKLVVGHLVGKNVEIPANNLRE